MERPSRAESEHPFQLIFRLGLAIEHLNQGLEGKIGLSVPQWSILSALRNCPAVSPFVLAKLIGIQPSTLTQALKRLESKNYLFMGPDPLDRRKKILCLSKPGKEVLDRAEKYLQDAVNAQVVDWNILIHARDQIQRVQGDIRNRRLETNLTRAYYS